jgi:hypothetical protein
MSTQSTSMQADLLRELVDEAHQRVRELQAQIDHLSATLQRISLFDGRAQSEQDTEPSSDALCEYPLELHLSSLRVPQCRQWLIFPHL